MNVDQVIKGAQIVISGGSSDEARASLTLLKAGQDLAQAQLVSIFERAQADVIKELARLKNRDLVTFHTEAALARVNRILGKMRGDAHSVATGLVGVNVLHGRLGARLRTGGGDFATALDLAQGDESRVQRLVDQLMGNIEHAAACAEQSIRNQVATACVRAQTPESYGDESKPTIEYPGIEQSVDASRTNARETSQPGLTGKKEKELKTDPVSAAKGLAREIYDHISRMRQSYVIGRREADILRKRTLESMAVNEARGTGLVNAERELLESIMSDGVVAFVDRGGHKWSLANYCSMTVRTTSRTSSNMGELYEDPEHDLYRIVPHGSSCPVCARYEGRVYSRSGTSPYYPPLSTAFGKIDPNGSDSLENTYLSIHPNCRHVLSKWVERAMTPLEIEAARRKSNPETNPFDIDPRTEKQIKEYKERERIMARRAFILRKYREFLQYVPPSVIGTFPKFEIHFEDKDSKYREIIEYYRQAKAGESK